MNAAFGVVIVCVAFATTMEVMMATTVAMRMTPGRENFWIRIVIAFILFGFLLCWFSLCGFLRLRFFVSRLDSDFAWNQGKLVPRPVRLRRNLTADYSNFGDFFVTSKLENRVAVSSNSCDSWSLNT